MLALAVGVLILIDITILLIYTAVEGYLGNIEATLVPDREMKKAIEGVCGVCVCMCKNEGDHCT